MEERSVLSMLPPRDELEQQLREEIARELHDRVAQTLTAMVVEMESFKADQYGRQSVLNEIDTYQGATREVLWNIRDYLFSLRGEPTITRDFVQKLRARLERFQLRSGIETRLELSAAWPEAMSTYAAGQVQRIIDEGLHNARMHAGARLMLVSLEVDGDSAVVTIADDGRGIDMASEGGGMGLLGMRERALLLGGRLKIMPAVPQGTVLQAEIPRERLL